MNALTLHQPYATLVALGVKTIETRSWPAPASAIGQRLVIHAATGRPARGEHGVYFVTGRRWLVTPDGGVEPLPLGAVVASCTLTGCAPIGGPTSFRTGLVEGDDGDFAGQPVVVVHDPVSWLDVPGCLILSTADTRSVDITDQLPYGDFRPGRWAWLLDDIKPTTERCPAGCHGGIVAQSPGNPADGIAACDVCKGEGRCDPIPAKGHQRLWKWEP